MYKWAQDITRSGPQWQAGTTTKYFYPRSLIQPEIDVDSGSCTHEYSRNDTKYLG